MVSMVIPTRNRESHLRRLLRSINSQRLKPTEIFIVDSSEDKNYQNQVMKEFQDLNIQFVDSEPSVCIQRNTGIKLCNNEIIFLCDDDIELQEDYILQNYNYLMTNNSCLVSSGLLMQQENGSWVFEYPPKNFRQLIWRFIFQLPVWGSINHFQFKGPFKLIHRFYERQGNSFTFAGWPLITNWNNPIIKTQVYSLGANFFRRKTLLENMYDEVLDASGIGDNFGIASCLPKDTIHILSLTKAFHHLAPENRLKKSLAYYRRILAMDYFLQKNKIVTGINLWLIWSLIGNVNYFILKREFSFVRASLKIIFLLMINRNPYKLACRKGLKVITPTYI